MRREVFAPLALGLCLISSALADTTPPAQTPSASTPGACSEEQKSAQGAETQGQVTIGGKVIKYKASVGYTEVTLDPANFSGIFNNEGLTPATAPTTPQKACIFS